MTDETHPKQEKKHMTHAPFLIGLCEKGEAVHTAAEGLLEAQKETVLSWIGNTNEPLHTILFVSSGGVDDLSAAFARTWLRRQSDFSSYGGVGDMPELIVRHARHEAEAALAEADAQDRENAKAAAELAADYRAEVL